MRNMKKFIIVGLLLGVAFCQGSAKRTAKSTSRTQAQPKAKQSSGPERDLMRAVETHDYNAIRRINQENPNLQQSMRSRARNTGDGTNYGIFIDAANQNRFGQDIDVNMVVAFSGSEFQLYNPLEEALRRSDVDLARDLIQAGANVNAIGIIGDSMLHMAANRSFDPETEGIVSLLIQNGADVLALDEHGRLPIEMRPGNEALREATLLAIETQGRTDLAERLRDLEIL